MYRECLLVGRRGLALRAMSAIDMALWDLAARRATLPLAIYLGGSLRPMPAYASGGYYRPSEGSWTSAVDAEIRLNIEKGFVDHKIKVGGLSIVEDADRVRAAIHAMDGRGRLALDANNAYSSPAEALRALHAFEGAAGDQGLWWFEEPLSVDDVDGLSRVRSKAHTPVATGEISQGRYEFRQLIDSGAVDVLQPDVGVLGGVTEFMRVIRTAETYQIPVAPHWHANAHVHVMAAATTNLAIEHFLLSKDIYNFERLLTPESQLPFDDGMVAPSAAPGFGIAFDEAAVNEFAISGKW
jgi:L-alanine-DL-glutamate epimerase-like enolase superfamily enzyme